VVAERDAVAEEVVTGRVTPGADAVVPEPMIAVVAVIAAVVWVVVGPTNTYSAAE